MVEEESLVEEESTEIESSKEEEGSTEEEAPMEEKVPIPKKNSQVGPFHNLTRPSMGLIFEISIMIENDIIGICEKYQILDDFHLHALRSEDRMTFWSSQLCCHV